MNRAAIRRGPAAGILSAVVGLLLASSGLAGASGSGPVPPGIPDPSTSTVPPCLTICPSGDRAFTVVVRDVNNGPVSYAIVAIDLGDCAGAMIALCDHCTQADYDPATRRFVRKADVLGVATFQLCGSIQCPSGQNWARVLANGVLLALPINVVTTDLDGDRDVDAQDVAIVTAAQGGSLPPADQDCSGAIDGADVAIVEAHVGHGCPVATADRVVINEVVVDPQQDWDDTAGGNGIPFDEIPGVGTIDGGLFVGADEWIEIVNATGSVVDLSGWTLEMLDSGSSSYDLGGAGPTVRVLPPGSVLSAVPPGGVVVIGNPPGAMDIDVHLVLRDASDLVVDEVEIGDDPEFDGPGDGAPEPGGDGNASSPADEAIARVPDTADTDVDVADFVQQAATIGRANSSLVGVPALPLPPVAVGVEVHPHPVRGAARLTLRLPERSQVELTIHDVAGREVLRESMPSLGAGTHPYTWTSPPRSGVYWVRLRGRGMDTGRPFDVPRKVTVVR
jgi:hypothetical protein